MGRFNQTAHVHSAGFISQSGFASLIVLIIMTTALSLGLEIYFKANGENRIAQREAQGRQAVYEAEAGIEWAKYQLAHNTLWRGGAFIWEEGKTEVSVIPVSGGYQVTATAEASLARRKLQVEMIFNEGIWVTKKYQELHN